jgi:hypothetical protein
MKALTPALLLPLTLAALVGCDGGADSATPEVPPPPDRLVEEGDIVRLDGRTMYVLARSRGLVVVDLAEPARPVATGVLPYVGNPLELYLRQQHVVAVVRAPVDRELCPHCEGRATGNSAVLVVDVADRRAPRLVAKVGVDGEVDDTRFVGDVLYVAARGSSGLSVQSIDLREPQRPRAVQRLDLPAGRYSHVHVTDSTFYVATVQLPYDTRVVGECSGASHHAGCTVLTAIDVSSHEGELRVGASYALEGYLQQRWAIDHFQGVLRLIVPTRTWGTSRRPARIRTFQARTAAELEPLADVPILTDRPESLMAVRFDGARAFAVTFERRDPLFTIDLSDPTTPRVVGHLETPGWLDFMIPRGDRLIAVGRDQDRPDGEWKLHASLYDVGDLTRPQLVARAIFGQGGADRIVDEPRNLAKVVRVVDEMGLILVPFLSPTLIGELQLFQFTHDTLERAGNITHSGRILRALPLGPSHLVTVSHQTAEVVEVSDPKTPIVVGDVSIGGSE